MQREPREAARAYAWAIDLPAGYRPGDPLGFHARDTEGIAEAVKGDTIRKGFMWGRSPTLIEITLDGRRADCRLCTDGDSGPTLDTPARVAERMLGLNLDVAAFESVVRDHPLLGPLTRLRTGLRIPMAATPYEALSWAITGQQISLSVALKLRRELIRRAGRPHSSGLWCHPDAAGVGRLSEQQLRTAGFSTAKSQTLLSVSRQVEEGALPLDRWLADGTDPELIRERLVAVRGIGPWTADYTLLRGYGWPDGALHGDAALRNSLQSLLGESSKVSVARAERWLAPFAPWRSLVAAHLWARAAG